VIDNAVIACVARYAIKNTTNYIILNTTT